jgi:hypothetical protein
MAIDLQLVIRVFGSWTIFARIESEPNSVFTKEDHSAFIKSLNIWSLGFWTTYSVLHAELYLLDAYWYDNDISSFFMS